MSPIGSSLNLAFLPIPRVTALYRAKIVVIDLKKDVRYSLTQPWDLSVEELTVRSCFFSPPGEALIFLQFSQYST